MPTRRFLSRDEIAQIASEVLGDLLPGRPEQGILVESAVQNYRVGSRLQLEDGRVFRYCEAGEDMDKTCIGAGPGTGLIEGNTAVAAAAGAKQLTIVNATAVAHQYKDGWVVLFTHPVNPAVAHEVMLRIRDNEATSGGNVVIYLKDPLPEAAALPTFTSIWPNMYRNILTLWLHQQGLMSVTNVPPIPVTSGYFYWGQTWGMCFGVPSPAFGSGASERDLVFHIDGSLRLRLADVGGSQQRAGFLIPETTLGNDQGYMLQLSP